MPASVAHGGPRAIGTQALEIEARAFLDRALGQKLSPKAWHQAVLPLRLGGLGLPDLATLPAAAFLGSLAATLQPMAAERGGGGYTPQLLFNSVSRVWRQTRKLRRRSSSSSEKTFPS